jgi:hypothetical protein
MGLSNKLRSDDASAGPFDGYRRMPSFRKIAL